MYIVCFDMQIGLAPKNLTLNYKCQKEEKADFSVYYKLDNVCLVFFLKVKQKKIEEKDDGDMIFNL